MKSGSAARPASHLRCGLEKVGGKPCFPNQWWRLNYGRERVLMQWQWSPKKQNFPNTISSLTLCKRKICCRVKRPAVDDHRSETENILAWYHTNFVDVLVQHRAPRKHDRRPSVLETLGQVAVGVVVAVHVTCRCAVRETVVVVRVEELREVRRTITLLAAEPSPLLTTKESQH